jgi:ubiquinone/menaquinone biosynthesis C-methylase UbiE
MTFDWKTVWDRKGNSDSTDFFEISGFEHYRSVDTVAAAKKLTEILDIKPTDRVLEIGCGAGLLARHLDCHYVGTDFSETIVKKTIALNGFSAIQCDSTDLIFKDKSFDQVFAFGVFHYFPNYEYARKAILEMLRVAKKAVCVSDIPLASNDPNHLVYDETFFPGWQISNSFYDRKDHKRFTAVLYLDEDCA